MSFSYNFKILDGNKVVEIKSDEIGKGKAAKDIIEKDNYDFFYPLVTIKRMKKCLNSF